MAAAEEKQQQVVHVFWHDGVLAHYPTPGSYGGLLDVLEPHHENADRLRNIRSILHRGPVSRFVQWHQGRLATIPELHLFHTPEYVQELVAADEAGGTKVFSAGEPLIAGPRTCFNPGSWQSTLYAAGTTLEAMQHLLDGKAKLAYSLVRPPGHHAQPSQADGYCFLNNAALAVELALRSGHATRVAVVDIDVHFGNGAAAGYYTRDDVLTVSLHMNHGSWGSSHPQSDQPDQIGAGKGTGFNLNIPLPHGTGDRGYEYAMEQLVVPKLGKFKPDIIVVPLGLDSSAFDPNGRQCLTMDGYRALGRILRRQADLHSAGRLLLVQEGGYQLSYTAFCAHGMLEGVLDVKEPLLEDPLAYYPEDETLARQRVDQLKCVLLT